jgi:hypothetical protein
MNAETKIEAANLSSAMALAFAEIESAKKDASNPHFNAKFASLGSVMEAIKPALAGHGLFFTQASHVAEDGVCVETIIHHSSGETLSCGRLYVPANKKDAQGFGSALTYARRYSLMTAFGVPAEDDDGNAAVSSAPAREKVPGIHKIKERLSKLRKDGDAATDLDTFNALIREHKDDLKTIRDANHEWWTGDGEDFEGFAAWKDRRKAELTPQETSLEFQLLLSTLNECGTKAEYDAWLAKNGDVIDTLDGAESRQFEAAHDAKVEALKPAKAPTPLEAGAFGG